MLNAFFPVFLPNCYQSAVCVWRAAQLKVETYAEGATTNHISEQFRNVSICELLNRPKIHMILCSWPGPTFHLEKFFDMTRMWL